MDFKRIFEKNSASAMLRTLLPIACCLASWTLQAQEIVCSDTDRNLLDKKLEEVKGINQPSYGDSLVVIGKTFLRTPYVAKTLEVGDKEALVVNLRGVDCTTYVENVMALGVMLSLGKSGLESYANTLEAIRYRDGKLAGYPSRLHYFSEWIANNDRKGLIREITEELGGIPITKNINFMSAHRELYPFLREEDNYLQIKASERYLNNRPIYVLAKDKIESAEHLLKDGDIIALATSIEGLDVTHTGFAIRLSSGRIHLLHASSSGGEVEVSELPLADYLKNIRHNTGIMVARPL